MLLVNLIVSDRRLYAEWLYKVALMRFTIHLTCDKNITE